MDNETLSILALLHHSPNKWQINGKARLHALVFHLNETTDELTFTFEDDLTSTTVQQTVKQAASEDLLTISERPTFGGDVSYTYTLTEKGNEMVQNEPTTVHAAAADVMDAYGDVPVSNLLQQTVEEYPRYKPLF